MNRLFAIIIVIPAKAGAIGPWTPAFAEMTVEATLGAVLIAPDRPPDPACAG